MARVLRSRASFPRVAPSIGLKDAGKRSISPAGTVAVIAVARPSEKIHGTVRRPSPFPSLPPALSRSPSFAPSSLRLFFYLSLSPFACPLFLSRSLPRRLGRARFLTLRIHLHLSLSRLKVPSLPLPPRKLPPHHSPPSPAPAPLTIARSRSFIPLVLFSRRKRNKSLSFCLFLSLMLRECGNPLVR